MKKWLSVCLALLLTLCLCVPVSAARDTATTDDGLTYEISAGCVYITGYTEDISSELYIPSSIEGYPVIGLSPRAFLECEPLVRVTVSGSVVSIGDRAFEKCTNLKTVTLKTGRRHQR